MTDYNDKVERFEDLRNGDWIKVRVGNERPWFQVVSLVDEPANAVIATMGVHAVTGIVFDGRATFDREWIIDMRRAPEGPQLRVVGGEGWGGAV